MSLPIRQKIIAIGSVLLFLLVVILYVQEFYWLSNTFDASSLVWNAVILGSIFGAWQGYRWSQKESDSVGKIRIYAMLILLSIAFAPLVGSLSNRLLSFRSIETQSFEFWNEQAYAAERFGFIAGESVEPDGWFIFFIRNGALERIKSKQARFEQIARGEQIELPIRKGLWGYAVVVF